MNMRSALGEARGHGSARHGARHWWLQRVSALALVPLMLWFVSSLVTMVSADHAAVVAWIASPPATLLLLSLVALAFFHAKLGLQVVLEDYVHVHWLKVLGQIGLNIAMVLLALAALLAILRISLGVR